MRWQRHNADLYDALVEMGQAMAAMAVAIYEGTDDARKAALSAQLDAWDSLRTATGFLSP